MGLMSIREFNRNASAAFARVIARITAEPENPMDDPDYRAAHEEMMKLFRGGLPYLGDAASYEERTGR
jgi:hypothetical protein